MEGMLRFGVSYAGAGGGWTWEVVAWATRNALERCQAIQAELCPGAPPHKDCPHQQTYDYLDRFAKATDRMRSEVGLADPTCAPWLTVVEDYDKAPEATLRRRCNAEAPTGWRVLGRRRVNFRPHPFVIGQAHLRNSTMILDPSSAPCAGCGRGYADHKYDTVLLVQASAENGQQMTTSSTPEPVKAWLKRIVDLAAEANLPVDGVALVSAD